MLSAPFAGICEPIKGGVEAGLRLGLGKAEEDSYFTAAENIVRKRLEVEVQAEEDEERTRRREVPVLPLIFFRVECQHHLDRHVLSESEARGLRGCLHRMHIQSVRVDDQWCM